jgi:hypothetical protein
MDMVVPRAGHEANTLAPTAKPTALHPAAAEQDSSSKSWYMFGTQLLRSPSLVRYPYYGHSEVCPKPSIAILLD